MSLKDEIRKLTVGSKNEYRTKEIDFQGQTVVFRQPSLKERKDIVEKSVTNREVDGVSMQIWAVIYLTYDAEGSRVFDEADFDSLINKPSGSFVDTFAEHALSMLGNGEEAAEEEA